MEIDRPTPKLGQLRVANSEVRVVPVAQRWIVRQDVRNRTGRESPTHSTENGFSRDFRHAPVRRFGGTGSDGDNSDAGAHEAGLEAQDSGAGLAQDQVPVPGEVPPNIYSAERVSSCRGLRRNPMKDETMPNTPVAAAMPKIISTGHQLVCRMNGGRSSRPVSV